MALVGYARVSTTDQTLETQIEQLTAAGCAPIFQEKKSGTTVEDRPEWFACLSYLREGDTLVATRLDRIGRSMKDLFAILAELDRKKVRFKCLLQPEIDTTTTNGRMIMGILAVIAQFETEMRRDRQAEGIKNAKARGVYTRNASRNGKLGAARIMLNKGMLYSDIALKLDVPERTLRRRIPGYGPRTNPQGHQQAAEQSLPPSAAEAVEREPTPKAAPPKHGLFGAFRR